jgi:hypothetical protein
MAIQTSTVTVRGRLDGDPVEVRLVPGEPPAGDERVLAQIDELVQLGAYIGDWPPYPGALASREDPHGFALAAAEVLGPGAQIEGLGDLLDPELLASDPDATP